MKVFITGIAGFIGSSIAKKLIARGHVVAGLDNLKTGLSCNLPHEADFFDADVRVGEDLRRIPIGEYDVIMHLAGQSSGELSHEDPCYDLDTNAKGTLNVLSVAHEAGVKRILNASSMGVYGQVTFDECPINESAQLNPLSFYGVSKLAGEKYCNYFISKGMNITSFRMFNVYGPGQNLDNTKQGMVSIYLSYILAGQPVVVRGSLDRFRDFVYISDVVDFWISAIELKATYGKVYNLGTGVKTTVLELVSTMLDTAGVSRDMLRVEDGTTADQSGIFGAVDSLKSDFGRAPRVMMADGIRQMWSSYRDA